MATAVEGVPALTARDMPYVTFVTETLEDYVASKAQNRPVAIDVDFVKITPPGSRDVHIQKVKTWFEQLKQEEQTGRVLTQWVQKWKADYALYQQGKEIPLDGTPIRGWKLLTGAQQENLIRLNILTVEALANVGAEAIAVIGMGAVAMKNRAESWLAQNSDKVVGAMQMATLKSENAVLAETVKNLTSKVEELSKMVEAKKPKN